MTAAVTTQSGAVLTPSHTTNNVSELRLLDASEITVAFSTVNASPTTKQAWRTAILPSQAAAAGQSLVSNGTDVSWGNPSPAVNVVAAATGAVVPTLAGVQSYTLTGAVTMGVPVSPVDGQSLQFRLTQDATGSRIVTWNAAYKFSGGSAPTLTVTAAKTDFVSFRYNAGAAVWQQNASSVLNV